MKFKKRNKSKDSPSAASFVTVNARTKSRLNAVWLAVCSTLTLLLAINSFMSSGNYEPIRQQALLDSEHKRIERQNLLEPAYHNTKFRKSEVEAAADFGKYAVLSIFSYTKPELENGVVRDRFYRLFSEDQALAVYDKQFLFLSQQKIVMAQDAIVRARVIGDLDFQGKKAVPYYGLSGRTSIPAMTYKFNGKMLLTVHGNQDYPTMFNFTILVQRARVQDKMMGYQIILLEVN